MNRFVIAGEGRDRQVSARRVDTMGTFVSKRSRSPSLTLFIDQLYQRFFIRGCLDDGARALRACASRLARGESFETKYFIEIVW